jgi:hypothetical protein
MVFCYVWWICAADTPITPWKAETGQLFNSYHAMYGNPRSNLAVLAAVGSPGRTSLLPGMYNYMGAWVLGPTTMMSQVVFDAAFHGCFAHATQDIIPSADFLGKVEWKASRQFWSSYWGGGERKLLTDAMSLEGGRRELLGNAGVGSVTPTGFMTNVITDWTTGGDGSVAVDIAADFVDGAAKDGEDSVQCLATDLKQCIEDSITNLLLSITPSKWDLDFASAIEYGLAFERIIFRDPTRTSGFCSMDKNIDCSPELGYSTGGTQEATICQNENECVEGYRYVKTTCFTANHEWCPQAAVDDGFRDWAKSCECKDLIVEVGGYHCNMDSNVCTAGKNPFLAPANKACDLVSSALFYGNPDYNRLCYVNEAWRCAGEPAGSIDSCLKSQDLLGPYLCREFCDSTFENEGNSLRTYKKYGASEQTCVCEVGSGRLASYPNKANTLIKTTLPTMSAARRHLLTDDTDDDTNDTEDGHIPLSRPPSRPPPAPPPPRLPPHVNNTPPAWAQPCNITSDCAASFRTPKLCKSLWGTPTLCYACSERGMMDVAYSCSAATRTCECASKIRHTVNTTAIDGTEWRGDSFCDKIMRGYHGMAR